MSEITKIRLVTDRSDLRALDVPDDCPGVVCIGREGEKDHVISVGLMRDVMGEVGRSASEEGRRGTHVYDVGSEAQV